MEESWWALPGTRQRTESGIRRNQENRGGWKGGWAELFRPNSGDPLEESLNGVPRLVNQLRAGYWVDLEST